MDLTDPRPLRDQVAALIARRIREGAYPVGSQIPTTKELARECDVGPRTVTEAVKLLREQGILRGLGGRGVFVIAVPEDDA